MGAAVGVVTPVALYMDADGDALHHYGWTVIDKGKDNFTHAIRSLRSGSGEIIRIHGRRYGENAGGHVNLLPITVKRSSGSNMLISLPPSHKLEPRRKHDGVSIFELRSRRTG